MTKKEYILDFLKEINQAYNHPAMYDDLKRLLDEMEEEILESANCKWIPVSERLPEKNDVYLVAVNSWGCPTRDVDGFMAHTDRKWEVYGNKVIAWMPLPDPYKQEVENG